MPAPTGSESQIGARFSKGVTKFGEDIWQEPVNRFHRIISMDGMNAQYGFVPVDNMDPSNQSLGGNIGSANLQPKFSFNPDVNSITPYLVHHCGSDPTIAIPAGGADARDWAIAPWSYGDPAPVAYYDSMILEHYDGQECGLVEGARLQDLVVKWERGKNIVADLSWVACSDTYESAATTILAAAYTAKPILKGHRAESIEGMLLKGKIVAAAAAGFDGTIKWTVGNYAGAVVTQFKFDTWYRLVLDTGAQGGVDLEQDLFFLVPATTPATAVTVNDEFSFTDARVPAIPSYSPRSVLRAGALEFRVDDDLYYFHGGDVKISRPRKANEVAGLIHPLTVQKGGKWNVMVNLNRDRDDTEFVKKLRRSKRFTAKLLMRGLPIEGNILESWQIDVTGKCSDVKRGVSGENTQQEQIQITAERFGGTDIFSHKVMNSMLAV